MEKKTLFLVEYMLNPAGGMKERIIATDFKAAADYALGQIGRNEAVVGGADKMIADVLKIKALFAVGVLDENEVRDS